MVSSQKLALCEILRGLRGSIWDGLLLRLLIILLAKLWGKDWNLPLFQSLHYSFNPSHILINILKLFKVYSLYLIYLLI
jgi:hypothetical protein